MLHSQSKEPPQKSGRFNLSPGDKLVYVSNAIKDKLLESEVLIEQAQTARNSSPPRPTLPMKCSTRSWMCSPHSTMSKQALNSAKRRGEMQDVLLGQGQL